MEDRVNVERDRQLEPIDDKFDEVADVVGSYEI